MSNESLPTPSGQELHPVTIQRLHSFMEPKIASAAHFLETTKAMPLDPFPERLYSLLG